jgi:deoxyribose-phosphate aldolase
MCHHRAGSTAMSLDIRDASEVARLALRCLDLTTLNDSDTEADIGRLCERACGAAGTVAAVCVWPRLAAFARQRLDASVAVAAVANFPAGGTDVRATLREVAGIVDAGAQEVDLVLPWRLLQAGDETATRALLRAVRESAGGIVLKVILETGELGEPEVIARAARLALDCDADFLKTSTGKTRVGATPPAAEILLQAIVAHPRARDRAGLKVAGGLRRVEDVVPYVELCARYLGEDALSSRRFRIGASALLDDIEAVLVGAVAPGGMGGY